MLWVVWFALFSSLFMYLAFLWPQFSGNEQKLGLAPMLAMFMAPAGASVFIRWFVVTSVPTQHAVLVASIIGMALAESLVFYGMFLFADYFKLFFIGGVLLVLQYIPLYTLNSMSSPPAVKDLSRS